MNSDWIDDLGDDGRKQWDDFVEHFRTEAVQMIAGSGVGVSLVPNDGKGDVKFWTELGCMIMLDKPIIAIAHPGATLSEKMKLVADEVVYADVDTEAGRQLIAEAIHRLVGE